jgi:hypothetical protein
MIYIIRKLFEEVFEGNIDLYNEFITMSRMEYKGIINILSVSDSIIDVRFQVHKLIGILSNLLDSSTNELIYYCKLLIMIDKNDTTIKFDSYKPYIEMIINFNNSRLGL